MRKCKLFFLAVLPFVISCNRKLIVAGGDCASGMRVESKRASLIVSKNVILKEAERLIKVKRDKYPHVSNEIRSLADFYKNDTTKLVVFPSISEPDSNFVVKEIYAKQRDLFYMLNFSLIYGGNYCVFDKTKGIFLRRVKIIKSNSDLYSVGIENQEGVKLIFD